MLSVKRSSIRTGNGTGSGAVAAGRRLGDWLGIRRYAGPSGTLTFDTQGEIIIASVSRFVPRRSCAFIHPSHRKLPSAHSELLERGPIMTPVAAAKKISKFDPQIFLSTFNGGRKITAFSKKQTIFVQ